MTLLILLGFANLFERRKAMYDGDTEARNNEANFYESSSSCEKNNEVSTNNARKERLNILREVNKYQALQLLREADENAPACSRKRETKLIEVEQKIEKHDSCPRKPVPIFKPVEIKQNATSILRECARIANEELKEVSKLVEKTDLKKKKKQRNGERQRSRFGLLPYIYS
ncbi:cilia- and flagella-associated protein 99-like [Vespula squamosa]|uniref:Cilia- and flagella-associated protein 99-like n=1 Tax=Vespula squamosa TaxID=30214 RepID=A0ABD2B9M6_VESSQ